MDEITPLQAMASLFRKKAAVMKLMSGGMEKAGKNTHFNYKYHTASDVKHAVGQMLADVGLSLQMSGIEAQSTSLITEKKDGSTKESPMLRIQFSISLCDVDTGAVETSLWFGEATASDDKSASKAATSALKYYILSNFLIGDKEEDERDTDTDNHRRPASSASKPRPAQSPAPSAPAAAAHDVLRYEDKDRFPKFLAWAKKTYDMSEADAMAALHTINGEKFQEAPADRARQACETWAQSHKKAS